MKTRNITSMPFRILLGIALISWSCTRDNNPDPIVPPSDGTTLVLNGGMGGNAAQNAVYVDLSAERQDSIKRTSWNLGFYCGSEFRVVLNGMTGTSAADAGTADIETVNSSNFDISTLGSGFSSDKMAIYDDTAGRIDRTVINEISANDDANHVYVINPIFSATPELENIWKVRILRNGNSGYTLHYAKLNATEFSTLTIAKDTDFNFKYISFANGPVDVEPTKADWDFTWGYHIYFTTFGADAIPYAFSDLVFINHLANVSAAEIIVKDADGNSTGKPTYADFSESNLNEITFGNGRNVIGSTWRGTTGTSAGVFTDRYYVIKDAVGNVYKLRFNAMGAGNDGGQRGYPELEYQLVKQG